MFPASWPRQLPPGETEARAPSPPGEALMFAPMGGLLVGHLRESPTQNADQKVSCTLGMDDLHFSDSLNRDS